MALAEEYAAMFAALAQEGPAPGLWELGAEDGRAMYRAMRPVSDELPIGAQQDIEIDGPHGSIPLRIYTPPGDGPFGVLMYFHGGGWVIGEIDTGDSVCRQLAVAAGVVVVSVGYRKAPEDIFPAAVDDCYAATQWAAANTETLSGNGKLGVTGESAGGNLATVMCLKARDEEGPQIDFQCLAYPVVDCDLSRASYHENGEGYLLETKAMEYFWDNYLPTASDRTHPYASPIHADLADLPPALVLTAEFDPLRDEGMAYAESLRAAGNEAEGVCFDGLIHDFFATAVMFECSKVGFNTAIDAIKQRLG